MLTKLMLAQAQACFFEKSTYAASPKLVAKLAMGVSELFKECTRLCQVGRMKTLQGQADVYNCQSPHPATHHSTPLPPPMSPMLTRVASRCAVRWCAGETHCYYQMLCYNAAAHYWHSKGVLAEDKYGEEIAHLERARGLLEQAAKAEGALLKNLSDNRIKLLQAIQQRISVAVRENELIYYATVPRPETVRDPEAGGDGEADPLQRCPTPSTPTQGCSARW